MNDYCCNSQNSCANRYGRSSLSANSQRSCNCGCGSCNARCYTTVLAVIGVLLALVIGIIIGVALSAVFTQVLPTVIAVAAGLAFLFVLFLLLWRCQRCCGR